MRVSELLRRLGKMAASYRMEDPDAEYERMELMDGQECLTDHVLYLGTCREFAGTIRAKSLKAGRRSPSGQPAKGVAVGAILLLTDTTYEETKELTAGCDAECILYTGLGTAEIFNRISRAEQVEAASPGAVWRGIVNRRLVTGEDIREAFGFAREGTYIQLLLIRAPGRAGRELAALFFAKDIRIREDGGVLVLRELDRQPESSCRLPEGLTERLEETGGSVVAGNASRDCTRLVTMHQILHCIQWLAGKLGRKGPVHTVDEYGGFVIIHYCVKEFIRTHGHRDILYLIHPALVHIARYDAEHGTDLRKVLYAYLLAGENVQRTSELLYMHRNTVQNKLKKIAEIAEPDFSDGLLCQRLLFSCQILEYAERILHRRI